MKLTLSILLIAAFVAGSYSQSDTDWVLAAKDRDGFTYSYNSRRFSRISPDVVETWIKRIDPLGSLKAKDAATTQVTREQFNCVSLSGRSLSAIYYNIDGSVVRESDFESDGDAKWTPVIPDSLGEQILSVVCQHQRGLEKPDLDISAGYLDDDQDIPKPKPKPKPKRKHRRH